MPLFSELREPASIPGRLFAEIQALVRDHIDTRETRRDSAKRLFEAVASEGGPPDPALLRAVDVWIDTTEWFVELAHDSGGNSQELEESTLRGKFDLFEGSLASLFASFFLTASELDEELEKANS